MKNVFERDIPLAMPLHVTESSGTKVYNLSAGKTLPEWLSSKKKKSLKQDEEYRGRIELIQDLDFPTTTQGLKFSRDGNFIAAVGNYPPQVKVYELSELSMKFNRYLDCDCVSFEILSDDFSKLVFLHADRTVEFHAKFGAYYKTRVPKAGRDMLLVPNTCDLVVGGSSSHLYRLNLEQGRFLAPFETSLPAVNSLVHSPELGLLLAGGEDGLLECWDPRCRRRASVLDVRTSERSFDVGSDVTALAVAGCGSLQCAVGTSGGYTLVYDLRSSVPLLCKDQMFGLPIRRVRFHNVEGQRHIISADSKIIKVWSSSEVSAAPLVSMEPPSDINDFAVQDNTGLVMVSCEMPRVQCLFVPALGPAPKWCSLLGSLTEELEETAQSAVYDDYKFVTTQELDALNLSHMIGTAMLRPYMHGFFMDARLHARSKAAANPFEYEEYRKSKIRAKIEEKTKGRIVNRGALAAGNKVSVNQELVDKITREQEEESKSEGRGRKKKIKGTGHLLQDDRFAALFSNPEFEIDSTSREYALLHPSESKHMHGRMDSDDEESSDAEKEVAAEIPVSRPLVESSMSSKFGSDAVEVDPENDPIRVVPRRVSDSKHIASSASAVSAAPKKSVKSMTLAERLLLDKNANDGQRVEVHSGNKTMSFTISRDKKGVGRVRPVKSDGEESDSDKGEHRGQDSEGEKRQRRSANKFLSKIPRK